MPAAERIFWVGTYTRNGSRGIYRLRIDQAKGSLSAPELAAETSNPTYLALSPDRRFLYSVLDTEAMAAGFAVDAATGDLAPLPASPAPKAAGSPCYLAVDATARTLVLAHYHTAVVGTLPIGRDGTLGTPRLIRHSGSGPVPGRQDGAHVHSTRISPDNRHVIVCDLGQDKIFTYRLDAEKSALAPADPPFLAVKPGSGPRHAVFSADGRRLYVSNELDNTVAVFAYEAATGRLAPRQTLPTLPADFAGANTAAEIALHPNGRALYVTNRGHDSVVRFRIDPATGDLALADFIPSGGKTPRGMGLSPDGAWLACGHQDSGTVCAFRVDAATGALDRLPGSAAVPAAVAILFLR